MTDAVLESEPALTPETTRLAARNATALAASTVVAKGLLFGWQLILARWLGSDDYGVYGTIGALMSVGAAIPEFGMGLLVLRDVARTPGQAGRYLTITLTLQPLLAVVGYGVLFITALLFGYDADLRALLALAGASLLIDSLGNMCYNQLLAIERMVISAALSAAHIFALVLLAGIALALDGGLWGLYTATIAAGMLRAGAFWWVLLRNGIHPQWPFDRALARTLLIDGAPIALTSFLALAYQHADKLLTTAFLGTDDTGQLTAGFVIVFGVIELLSTTVLVAVFPLMSRTYASGNRAMFNFMLEKLAFFNLTASLPIGVYTSLLAVPLSALVFGEGYTRTADILQILIWYTVVTMVGNVFANALLIENRQRRILAIRVGGLAINVTLLLALLPWVGVQGAAVASLIAEIVVLGLLLRSFTLPADWWGRVASHIWRLALAAGGMAGVVLALRVVHPMLAALAGAPVYLGLVLLSGAVAHDDWDLIYRLLTAMPGGSMVQRVWKRDLGEVAA